MKKELKILVLGALLHDIGKFAQRANRPCSKEMEEEYLPKFNGKPSHWHSLYSDYFIENDLPLLLELEKSRSRIARLASIHHRPDENDLSEMCVMIADRLSSGAERLENTEIETEAGFRESRLVSIFDEVEIVRHMFKPPGNSYYDLVPLEADSEKIFPRKGAPIGDAKEYIPLFQLFSDRLTKMKLDGGFDFYLESLISVMEKYTWSIPSSSYKTISDISLFDHSVSTAGIAQALLIFHKSYGKMPTWKDDESKFLLLGGDLSGIQKYIFGISKSSGRGVSKIFRARSFFLQAVMRSIVLEIQKRIGLFSVCRLVDSGGKFILLLPNTPEAVDELKNLNREIQDWFLQRFKGVLTMTLAWATSLTQQDFQLSRFQNKIDEVNEALEAAKLHKMHSVLGRYGPVIDTDYDEFEGGNCSLCEINAADDVSSARYEKKEGVAAPVCKDCCEQIVYIGKRLPKTIYLLYGKQGKIQLFGKIHLTLSNELPSNLKNVCHVETLIDDGHFSRSRIARFLPRITKEELADERWFKLFEREDGFHELIKNIDDSNDFIPKTFGMIAEKSRKELKNGDLAGRPLLGFLKADVDNLGLIFSMGFGEKLSIARLAFLSRMLNIFFSEVVVDLLKTKFPDIYVVFAGGDDLFLIGPWWQTLQFAFVLRKKLRQFCADNTDITLSCGILTAKSRLPMRKAAEIVEKQLELAKNLETKNRIKDSVCFLGEVLSWNELESLIDTGKKFDKALEEKKRTNFTTAFLYRLLTYHKMYRRFIYDKDIKSGKYLSQAHYDIGRNIRNKAYNNQQEIDMLYDIFAVGKSDRSNLDLMNIPLFYAMNLNRDFK